MKLMVIGLFLFLAASPSYADTFRTRISSEMLKREIKSDIEAEIVFGEQVAARILGSYPILKNDQLSRYLALIGNRVAEHSGRPELQFYFAALDTDEINAFAAPGGYIFITKGAITACENEDQLAAIIAHEIAHVSQKHIVKELKIVATDAGGTQALTSLATSSTDSIRIAFQQMIDKATEILMKRGYKQEDEYDADLTGTVFAAQAGYAPEALRNYVANRLDKHKQSEKLSTTHPPTTDRTMRLNIYLNEQLFPKQQQQNTLRRFTTNVEDNLR